MNKISLCSYTYNDGYLLHGMLATVPAWERPPDEIILVDDCSDSPFELTADEKKLPIRLLRNDQNISFTKTKHRGLSEASGDILVSADSDAILCPDFALKAAAALMSDPALGLVGPDRVFEPKADLLSSYYAEYGPASQDAPKRKDFINGSAFAIRRELWHRIGGFGEHDQPVAEDHYLCAKLLEFGYNLYRLPESSVRMTRVITRHVLCRRDWKWCSESWLREIGPDHTLPDYLMYMLKQARWRGSRISGSHNPTWIYFELLKLAHTSLEFCNALGSQGLIPSHSGKNLLDLLENKLKGYPALWRLLKSDLLRTSTLPLKTVQAPAPGNTSILAARCEWTLFADLLEEFQETSVLEYLEKVGVREILADEARTKADFSSY